VRFRRFNRDTHRSSLARVAHFYPAHAVALVGYIAVVAATTAVGISVSAEAPHKSGHVAASPLMLDAFPGVGLIDASAWWVAREVGAYILFPLLALLVARTCSSIVLAGTAAMLGVGVASRIWLIGPHRFHASHGLQIAITWARISVCFTAGCFLWTAWKYEYGVNLTTASGLGACGVVCPAILSSTTSARSRSLVCHQLWNTGRSSVCAITVDIVRAFYRE
jgi:hypothetical protein